MAQLNPADTNVFFTGNKGLNRSGRAKGGVVYDYVADKATGRKDVASLIIGGKPRSGSVPWFAQALHVLPGQQPDFDNDRIIRASVVEEELDGGKKRWGIGTFTGNVQDLVICKTGLDFVNGSTANHKAQLEHDGKVLRPHGIVAFDSDTVRLVLAESAELGEILKDPTLALGKTGDAFRVGNVRNHGRIIPSIHCAETSNSAWAIGPRGAALKGTITGEVFLLRRDRGTGEIIEKLLSDSQRTMFEKLLFADREAQRKAAQEARDARFNALRLKRGDLDDAARAE